MSHMHTHIQIELCTCKEAPGAHRHTWLECMTLIFSCKGLWTLYFALLREMPSRHSQLPLHVGHKGFLMVHSVLHGGPVQIEVSRSMWSLWYSWGESWHCRGRHDAQQALGHGSLFMWICPLLIGLRDAPWCVGMFLATSGTLISKYDKGLYVHASHSYQPLAVSYQPLVHSYRCFEYAYRAAQMACHPKSL